MTDAALASILRDACLQPVLVDIGASGAPPAIWTPIACESVYVGFDPDARELPSAPVDSFRRALNVDRAVTAEMEADEVRFYLTRSPFCSSTLRPAMSSLGEYLFADLFTVEREVRVPATTLGAALQRVGVDHIDWLKTDSQGTDLRLFLSLPEDIRSKVLALDVEPGLLDAYEGEDLFTDVHEEMRLSGFWLSDLHVGGAVRMRPATLAALDDPVAEAAESALRKSPGWVEARYLRTPAWLAAHSRAPREYILLWVFAILDRQLGFALDLAAEYDRRFPGDPFGQRLRAQTLHRLDHVVRGQRVGGLGSRVRRVLGRMRRLLPSRSHS